MKPITQKAMEKALASIVTFLRPYQLKILNDRSRRVHIRKGRQIGISFVVMLLIVLDVFSDEGNDWLVLSAGERQAKSLCRMMIKWVRAFDKALGILVGGDTETPWVEEEVWCPSIAEKVTTLSVTFRSGRNVLFVPANPDTVRGEARSVAADEYAFHADQDAIMAAVGPSTATGNKRFLMWSTTNGESGMFYEIDVAENNWSKYVISTYDAVAQGADIDIAALEDLLNHDAELIAQELGAQYVSTVGEFFPRALVSFAESDKCGDWHKFHGWKGPEDGRQDKTLHDNPIIGDMFADDFAAIKNLIDGLGGHFGFGFDVGRKNNMSTLWALKRESGEYGECWYTPFIINLQNVSYASQQRVIDLIAPRCRFGNIDARGIGAQLAEESFRKYGPKIGIVEATMESNAKNALAVKEAMEDVRLKVPRQNVGVRAGFKSIKRITLPGGQFRIEAAKTDEAGHADPIFALFLAGIGMNTTLSSPAYQAMASRDRAFGPSSLRENDAKTPDQDPERKRFYTRHNAGGRAQGF